MLHQYQFMFGVSTPRRLAGLLGIVVLLLLVYAFYQRENSDGSEFIVPSSTSADIQQTDANTPPPPELPAADLHSALTEVCADTATESAGGEWTQEEIQAQVYDFKQQKLRLSQNLSVSSSAEHLHLAALLEDDPASRIALLDRATSINPSDSFLVWSAVRICSEAAEATACPLRNWEQLLIVVDGQNSESWVRIAANRYAANEYAAALEAMRYASTAAETRAYWTETIEMVERGLAAGSDMGFPARAGMAFGLAASELPRYGDYIGMCEDRSAQSVDWAYACLAYGQLVEVQGKTEIGVSISRDIQRLALEALGKADKAGEIQRRQNERRQQRLDSSEDYNPAIERLIVSIPTLFSAYMAAIRTKGEEAARRQVTVEIERLIEEQPGLACEKVRVR